MRRKEINLRHQLVQSAMLVLFVVALGLFNTEIIKAQNKPVKNSDLKEAVKKDSINSNENDKVFTEYETMPQFPGGDQALLDFVYKNLKYPESAIKEKKEGKVILRFVVTKTGEIEKIQVARSLQVDCDNEAIRVVKMLPKFRPGKYSGKPVDISYILPVTFKLPTIDNTDVILNQKFEPDHIFDVVEQMPKYKDGDANLIKFIEKNIIIPTDSGCLQYISGRVICSMLIEKDGSISNIKVLKSLDSCRDKEAVRVVGTLPPFKPGKQGGKPVPVWYMVPITFTLK